MAEDALDGPNMVVSLPFDVWVAIASHLSVQSIVNLSHTCKHLSGFMEEYAIWSLALQDIVRIIPLRVVRDIIPSMSLQDIRSTALRAARIDALFESETVCPKNIQSRPLDYHVASVEVAPGGQWVLIMGEDGSVHLYPTRDTTRPVLTVKRPEHSQSSHRTWEQGQSSVMLSSWHGNYLAVVSEGFSIGGEFWTEFRVYHLDVQIPFMRLLTTIATPDNYGDSHFKEGLLLIGWEENESYMLDIRKIPVFPNDVEESVLVDLGPGMAGCITTILCRHMFLVFTLRHLFLYTIPTLRPVSQHGTNVAHPTPIAVYDTHEQTSSEDSKLIWDALCCHHEGKQSIAGENKEGDSVLVILPSPGQSKDAFVHHTMRQSDMGPSRAIWVKRRDDIVEDAIELASCTHLTKPDSSPGYMRLGRWRAPDPTRITSIPLSGKKGRVETISWDEDSGCIFVLVSCFCGGEHQHLLVIDML